MIRLQVIAVGAVLALTTSGACCAERGIASVYSTRDAGQNGSKTACGPRLVDGALTAAHKTLPCGTKVRVSRGARSVIVTITDRGPFVRGRIIDLTPAAAGKLGIAGLGHVVVEPLSQ